MRTTAQAAEQADAMALGAMERVVLSFAAERFESPLAMSDGGVVGLTHI
jgi:hypothetical protein